MNARQIAPIVPNARNRVSRPNIFPTDTMQMGALLLNAKHKRKKINHEKI